jgi:hypothetical protein
MIAHVVLLNPRPDLPAAEARAFAEAFEHAVREIPTVRGVRIGRRVTHGAGYEAAAPPFEFLAVIDFDDLQGLKTYLEHPAHEALGARFGRIVRASEGQRGTPALVFDFEVGGIEALDAGGILQS